MATFGNLVHVRRGIAAAGAAALFSGCSEVDYVFGDWEFDVVAALPQDAEQMRICVDGVGVTTLGAGNGRAAVSGLPPEPTTVRVEVYDADGIGLLATSWILVSDDEPTVSAPPADLGATPCAASGEYAEPGSDDRILAVRFIQE